MKGWQVKQEQGGSGAFAEGSESHKAERRGRLVHAPARRAKGLTFPTRAAENTAGAETEPRCQLIPFTGNIL